LHSASSNVLWEIPVLASQVVKVEKVCLSILSLAAVATTLRSVSTVWSLSYLASALR